MPTARCISPQPRPRPSSRIITATAIDGLKDGLIDDPRKCDFNPKVDVPACSAGADGANCLTAAQAEFPLRGSLIRR